MEFYDVIFKYTFNIFGIYVLIRTIRLFLKPKKIKKSFAFMLYLVLWFANSYVYFKYQSFILTTVSLFIELMLVAVILYNGSIFRKIFAVTASQAFGIGIENILWVWMEAERFSQIDELTGCILSPFISLIVIIAAERFIKFDRHTKLPTKNYIFMFFIFLGTVVLAEVIIKGRYENKYIPSFGLCMISLTNIIYFFLYDKLLGFYREEARNRTMDQQIKMYSNQMKILSLSNSKIQAFRHDYKNHILLLKQYLINEKYEKALKYTERMALGIENYSEICKSGNTGVDSIMNYLLGQLDREKYDLNIHISIPDELNISDFDLNIILGNLLENSIEALKNQKKGTLDIHITFDRGILYICIQNSILKEALKKDNFFPTSKSDRENHGIGLSNVQRTVEKYDGTMKITQTENNFIVNIIIYIKLK